ncbi:MAG: hypothetical protein JW910_08115, partial [Anaerolineae bacterium]|nr:hypothetical protein [Anaerolineae bacterium]
ATRDPDDALLNAEARFRPVAVSVREADGSSYRVVLPNGTAWLVGLLLASGMAVILVCQWIIHRAKQERVGVPGSRITRPDFAATVQPRREYDVPL